MGGEGGIVDCRLHSCAASWSKLLRRADFSRSRATRDLQGSGEPRQSETSCFSANPYMRMRWEAYSILEKRTNLDCDCAPHLQIIFVGVLHGPAPVERDHDSVELCLQVHEVFQQTDVKRLSGGMANILLRGRVAAQVAD